jgi:8-hydroxy-5-deazaflavin:NADPH oxidoreductase
VDQLTIAIIGGTGAQGRGLASRFVRAGHTVRIGSRDPERAAAIVDELRTTSALAELDPALLRGGANAEVVAGADLVVLSTPYAAQASTLPPLADRLAGSVVVSCVNPLTFDDLGPTALDVPEGSAAEQAASLLPEARVVAAFHHLSAPTLLDVGPPHDESVLVCGDDADAKAVALDLAATVAARGGVDAGPLRNARYLEALTVVLIDVNRRYRARSGIAVTGLPD